VEGVRSSPRSGVHSAIPVLLGLTTGRRLLRHSRTRSAESSVNARLARKTVLSRMGRLEAARW
jgi:hypothetical protein